MNLSIPGIDASDVIPVFWSYDDPALAGAASYVIPDGVRLTGAYCDIAGVKVETRIDAVNWRTPQDLATAEYNTVIFKNVKWPALPVSDGTRIRVRNTTGGAADIQLIGEEYP